jgi:hypothetical protein
LPQRIALTPVFEPIGVNHRFRGLDVALVS